MLKRSSKAWILAAVWLTACAGLRTREEIRNQPQEPKVEVPTGAPGANGPVQVPHFETLAPPSSPETPQASPIPALPKIGLIFGPGGARAYGHIGFLQNLNRLKVPVHGAVGIEWGAPVAALWAMKGQIYDVEWQMFKLKDDDLVKKSLLGGSSSHMNDAGLLAGFFQNAFGQQKVEEFRHPFACPSYNISRNQVFMMNHGIASQLLPYCVPYPPLLKPFNHSISAVRELKMAADYLRQQGANYIVLVNAFGSNAGRKALTRDADSPEAVMWSEVASFYSRPQPGIDAVINEDLDGFLVTDFEKKREIMQKGAEVSQKPLENWARKFGF